MCAVSLGPLCGTASADSHSIGAEATSGARYGFVAESPCFVVTQIQLDGARLLSTEAKDQLLSPFRGQCVGLGNIQRITRAVTEAYIAKGYIAARVYIPEQDLASGLLRFEVVEGELEQMLWNGSPDERRGHIAAAFPRMLGQPVNLRDLEQGIRQLSRMQSFAFDSDIRPGDEVGGTVIGITASRQRLLRGSARVGNTGSNGDAVLEYGATLTADGYLGLGDVISLSFERSSDTLFNIVGVRPPGQTVAVSASVPWGYSLFSASYEDFRYGSTFLTALDIPVDTRGHSRTISITGERAVYHDGGNITRAHAELRRLDVANFLSIPGVEEVRLNNQSRTTATARLGFSHYHSIRDGSLTISVGVKKGIGGFGTTSPSDRSLGDLSVRGLIFDLGASATKFFDIGGRVLSYRGVLASQFTEANVPGDQRFAIGGENDVRGTRATVASGLSGITFRNDLSTTISSLISRDQAGWDGELDVFVGLDFGAIAQNDEFGITGASLLGGAFGLRGRHGKVSFSLSYEDILSASDVVWDRQPDHGILVAEVSVAF